MRMGFLLLLILLLPGLAVSNSVKTDKVADYCYKPNKPLLFSKHKYQKRYEQDLKEYQQCVKDFRAMQNNLTSMRLESEKNAQQILDDFVGH